MTDISTDLSAAVPRLPTRLTVLGWPEDPTPALEEAVAYVTGFEGGNPAPLVLGAGGSRHLAWRGDVTGGVATLYEQLAPLLADSGLDATFSDPRMEVYVPADGPVTVLAAATARPMNIDRGAFEERVSETELVGPLLAAAPSVGEPRADVSWHAGLREVLAGAQITVVERRDPDGLLEETWASCRTAGRRVDFMAPGTSLGEESLEASLGWRLHDADWLPARTPAEEEDADHGRWRTRSRRAISARDAATLLPDPLLRWIVDATRNGLDLCHALTERGDPHFAPARLRLRAELAQLRTGPR